MIDPVKILQRAWHILWNYRALWVFGLILAIATSAGPSSNAGGNGSNNRAPQSGAPNIQVPSYSSVPEAFNAFKQEIHKLLTQGIPEVHVSGETVVTFLWVIGVFVLIMFLIGIVVTIAYYASVTSVIRMVDEYENTGTKMTVREGFRVGWSRSAWRVFLINLIVHLPVLLLVATVLAEVAITLVRVINGITPNAVSIVTMAGLTFLATFLVLLVTFILLLLRPFFWRVAVLENVGVGESLRRGFAMVRENWKSVGVMWLVMIGLGLAWTIVFFIAILITIPVVILTSIVAATVVAIPALLLFALFSAVLGGPVLPWIAAGLFVLPLFGLIAFSPWLVLGSWQTVYTSTVWTLTYREIKALPATLVLPAGIEPVGD